MANKSNPTIQSNPTKASGVIVNKAVENIKEDSTKQVQSKTNKPDYQQKIATTIYCRASHII